MRRVVIGAAALAMLGTSAAVAEPVKIGFIATMSGPAGALGRDLLDGFQLGIEHAGGKLGGQEIELLTDDDQLKPEVGLQVATRMIEKDGVDIITGIVFSNVMMAVAKPVTDAGARAPRAQRAMSRSWAPQLVIWPPEWFQNQRKW